jgi:NADH:ubiquinone oxidoreductase subunit F (NADH-binding)
MGNRSVRRRPSTSAGAYICGEETALFNSVEGFAASRETSRHSRSVGTVRQPTVVNNVETLANVSTSYEERRVCRNRH